MHIYAFGSVCRGDIDVNSDVDLLAIVAGREKKLDSSKFSIYGYDSLQALWEKGNPFSWHLYSESRLIFSSDSTDFIKDLGRPHRYSNFKHDFSKFYTVFLQSCDALQRSKKNRVFELSTIFLCIRNIATCFALQHLEYHEFSRHAAQRIGPYSIPLDSYCYKIFENARLLNTRGKGLQISVQDEQIALTQLSTINNWMVSIERTASE